MNSLGDLRVDEIDKALAGSAASAGSDGGTSTRVFGTILTWLSEKTSPVFVICTADQMAHLPPELLRKGRLDEIFFVDLPSESERVEILRIHLQKRGRDPAGFDLRRGWPAEARALAAPRLKKRSFCALRRLQRAGGNSARN